MAIATILAHARETPDRIALVHERGSWSYAAFAGRILAARESLARQGLGQGGTAIACVGWLPEAWVYSLALRSLGFATMAATDLDTLAKLPLGDEGCIVSLDSAPLPASSGFAARSGWKSVRVPAKANAGASRAIPEAAQGIDAGMADQITMTSGTTGAYKLVRRNALAESRSLPALDVVFGLVGVIGRPRGQVSPGRPAAIAGRSWPGMPAQR